MGTYRLEQEEEKEHMTELKLIPGGKMPPSGGSSTNWMTELEEGSVILIQDRRSDDFNLGLFKLLEKTDKYCLLVLMQDEAVRKLFVNPFRFCQKYALVEVLGTVVPSDLDKQISAPEIDIETVVPEESPPWEDKEHPKE